MFVVLAVLAVLLPARPVYAATLDVCPTLCAYTTIQAAIDAASAGDTITVQAGTYAEHLIIGKPLTLSGAGASLTIISGDGSGYGITLAAGASGTTVQGLTVRGFVRGIDTETSGVNDVTLSQLSANSNSGYGIATGNGAVDARWTLDRVTATDNAVGLRIRGQLDVLNINDSHFDGNQYGFYSDTSTATPAALSHVMVVNSTFSNNTRKGMYFEVLDHASFDLVQVVNSGGTGVDINLKYASYSTISFTNSLISGSTGVGIYVKGRNDGSYTAPAASLTGVTLSGNTITANALGVAVENNVTSVSVDGSDLSGNASGGLGDFRLIGAGGIALADPIAARHNWWGSAAGPGTLTDVDTLPWCTAPTCSTSSDNADLAALSLSGGSLSPAFSPSITSYTASVANSVVGVSVSQSVNPGASAVVSGGSALSVGTNSVTVTVTSADATVTKTYAIAVVRAAAPAPPPPPPPTAPPLVVLPPTTSPGSAPIVTTTPVRLPDTGVVTAPVTLQGTDGAIVTLPQGIAATTPDGQPYRGTIGPPTRITSPASLVGLFDIQTSAPITFDHDITLTLPSPAGADASRLQPVTIDGDGRTVFLVGRATPAGVAFEVNHLSRFGLAQIASPVAAPVTRTFVKAAGYHGLWAGESDWTTLSPGQMADLSVRFVNTGHLGWYRNTFGAQAILASNEPLDNTRDADRGIVVSPLYNGNRFALQSEAYVGPGDVGTFGFRVRAPQTPGVYQIHVRPVIEGTSWLEDEGVYLQITVR